MVVLPLLFVGLAIPMIRGGVKPNRLYGVRTPKTPGSQELWYRANRTAGYSMIIGTGASFLAWAALALLPLAAKTRAATDISIMAGVMVSCLLLAAHREGAF